MPVLRRARGPDSPETLRIGDPWQVRVVPNLYPAFERQEVVVHTPRHARSLAELDDDELAFVAEAWRLRREAVPDGYLHALVNEGREAGSSLPHTHSQLVWLPEPPPETQQRVDRERWTLVAERDGLVLACPCASRLPYELVIAPARAAGGRVRGRAAARRAAAARRGGPPRARGGRRGAAQRVAPRLGRLAHRARCPRLSILAGVELGAGWWINALAPEDAAAALR